jgi:hypothetical protein
MALKLLPAKVDGKPSFAQIQYISEYVGDLRGIIGYYLNWVPEYYHSVEDFYKYLENDLAIQHAINLRSLKAAGKEWEIECDNEVLKKILTDILSHIKRFTHARKSMVEKAALYGLSVQKKYYKSVKLDDFGDVVWQVPYRLKEVDRRRMRIEKGSGTSSAEQWWTIWDPKFDQYVILEDRAYEPDAYLALQDFVFMWHTEEESSPYYKGLGEVVYGAAYLKRQVVQYWAALCEHFGRPIAIAQIKTIKAAFDAATKLGSGSHNATTVINNYIELIEKMRARHAAVIPDHDRLEFREAGSIGNNILREFLEYWDSQIQLYILGSELPTRTDGIGSYALGEVQAEQLNDIIAYDRGNIEETITEDLLYDIYVRNKYNFLLHGIKFWPGPGKVKFKIKAKKEPKDDGQRQRTPTGNQV